MLPQLQRRSAHPASPRSRIRTHVRSVLHETEPLLLGRAALICLPAGARIDPKLEPQIAGIYSNACGNSAQPMIRLYDDTMSIEVGGKKVAARKFRSTTATPAPAPSDYKATIEGEVPGGDGLVFVLTHNAQGLFATVTGGAKSLAPLGPGLVGQRIRHCDPNRNALPGALPPAAALGPTSLLADAKFKALYVKALGPLARERWLARLDGPAPGNKQVKLLGEDYTLAAACKPHDCGDNSMVLLYSPAQKVVYVHVHARARDLTLGSPPPALAAEMARLWKKEWRL